MGYKVNCKKKKREREIIIKERKTKFKNVKRIQKKRDYNGSNQSSGERKDAKIGQKGGKIP